MEARTALAWSWLNVLTKKRADRLAEQFGDLDRALAHLDEELLRSLGCRMETALKVLVRLEEFDGDAYASELRRRRITLVTLDDASYPDRLRSIADPPVFLHVLGDAEALHAPSVALVGTRSMSAYGSRVTEWLVPPLVRSGFVTVSGMAQGIDTRVAEVTLASGGRTVAVLGQGLGNITPSAARKLAERIVASGGAVMTEYPLDTPPDTYTFPARNRIIAGMTMGTVVLEAPEGSGALMTAEFALEEGRDVFVVPGAVFDTQYAGCLRLLARGQAGCVCSPEELLLGLGAVPGDGGSSARKTVARNDREEALLSVLSGMPQTVGDLTERTHLSPAQVNATLTMMELAGSARSLGDGTWVRS